MKHPNAPACSKARSTSDPQGVSTGELHGLGVSRRIEQITRGTFAPQPGSLFPALHRLEEDGWLVSSWQPSENNRRAEVLHPHQGGATAARRGDGSLEPPSRSPSVGRSRREAAMPLTSRIAALVGMVLLIACFNWAAYAGARDDPRADSNSLALGATGTAVDCCRRESIVFLAGAVVGAALAWSAS